MREIGHNLFRPLRAGGDSAALSRLRATVHGVAQCQMSFDPLAKRAPGESLGRLRRAVVKDAHHDNAVGMHVQSKLDRFMLFIRGLLRANFRVI